MIGKNTKENGCLVPRIEHHGCAPRHKAREYEGRSLHQKGDLVYIYFLFT
jgi:hypothetical protein